MNDIEKILRDYPCLTDPKDFKDQLSKADYKRLVAEFDLRNTQKYQLTMNEEQLRIFAEALEFYSRYICGHLEYRPPAMEAWLWNKHKDNWSEFHRDLKTHISQIKMLMFHQPLNAFLGIHCPSAPEEARTSYDMYRKVREYYAEKESGSTYNVYSHVHRAGLQPEIGLEELK